MEEVTTHCRGLSAARTRNLVVHYEVNFPRPLVLNLDPHVIIVALHAAAVGVSLTMTRRAISFGGRVKIAAEASGNHRIKSIKRSDQRLGIVHAMTVLTILQLRQN